MCSCYLCLHWKKSSYSYPFISLNYRVCKAVLLIIRIYILDIDIPPFVCIIIRHSWNTNNFLFILSWMSSSNSTTEYIYRTYTLEIRSNFIAIYFHLIFFCSTPSELSQLQGIALIILHNNDVASLHGRLSAYNLSSRKSDAKTHL